VINFDETVSKATTGNRQQANPVKEVSPTQSQLSTTIDVPPADKPLLRINLKEKKNDMKMLVIFHHTFEITERKIGIK